MMDVMLVAHWADCWAEKMDELLVVLKVLTTAVASVADWAVTMDALSVGAMAAHSEAYWVE